MKQKKNIFVLLGHPDSDSLSAELARVYVEVAEAQGHNVRYVQLGDLDFDPILHKGYKKIQELEPDLLGVQENMKWADHFLLIYPNWWNTMPALLKGMFDRMFLPDFAFRFYKDRPGWEGLLRGKTARVIVLSGNTPLLIRFLFGDYTNEITRGILGFAGYKVFLNTFGPTQHRTPLQIARWNKKVAKFAEHGI